jgi:hypothetical protein
MGGSRTRCSTTVAPFLSILSPPPVQFLPCRLRNRRHLRYGGYRHVIVFEGIERKLDVGICAIKVVGDNGGKPGAPTFEDLM